MDLDPGWEHTVFDEAGAERFLREHLGADTARAYRLCYHPAMMADMFRVAFISVAGGFYADADERCLQPLTDILPNPASVELVAPHSGWVPGHVDNNFIGWRPGSVLCRAVVAGMVEDILQCAHEGRRAEIWQVTGPGAMTRGVGHYLGAAGVQASDAVVLLPMQQYRSLVRTEEDLDYKRTPAANWRLAEQVRAAKAVCADLIARYPDWFVLSYFMADVVARAAGPEHALALLRADPRLPRDTIGYMGSEVRLLQETEYWEELLQRLAETPDVPRFPHVHHAGVTAMLRLGRQQALTR